MRLGLVVAVAAALAVGACRNPRPRPVPGPQSAPVPHSGVSEISWFQGTLEEAFSRRACPHPQGRHLLHY